MKLQVDETRGGRVDCSSDWAAPRRVSLDRTTQTRRPAADQDLRRGTREGTGRLHVRIHSAKAADELLSKRHRDGFGKTTLPPNSVICLTCDCPARRDLHISRSQDYSLFASERWEMKRPADRVQQWEDPRILRFNSCLQTGCFTTYRPPQVLKRPFWSALRRCRVHP